MNYETLLIKKIEPFILQLTLNRPEVRNAINLTMMKELVSFWSSIKNDDSIRCVILTGTSPAFCAGADLKARKDMDTLTWKSQHEVLQTAMIAMMNCNKPIIAAVNGAAFGGGLELTLAADFAYAVESAMFAQSETKLGIIPGAMGTQNLPRACGIRRAKELCFTGKVFDANDAHRWGIINEIFTDEKTLLAETIDTAKLIAANAPLAVTAAKQAMTEGETLPIELGYQTEVRCYNPLLETADRIEGINAFNEKRRANFKGK